MPGVLSVSDAKRRFPSLVRESSEGKKLFRVANARRGDAPRSVLVPEDGLGLLVQGLHPRVRWEEDSDHGMWTGYVPELDVYGQGSSREEATIDLLEAIREYVALYLEDPVFYLKVRPTHYLYVVAALLADDDPDGLRRLIGT